LWPRRISFRIGALITAIVGVLIQPWKLIALPEDYIFRWLIAYSALLGAVAGVLIADYYLMRHMRLDVDGLYRRDGPYWYTGGFNLRALIALAAGIAPCVPGFLDAIGALAVSPFWIALYHYAWFLSFAISFAAHGSLSFLRNHP
jgi:NCS1 family nucleobase:cation symporter-1